MIAVSKLNSFSLGKRKYFIPYTANNNKKRKDEKISNKRKSPEGNFTSNDERIRKKTRYYCPFHFEKYVCDIYECNGAYCIDSSFMPYIY